MWLYPEAGCIYVKALFLYQCILSPKGFLRIKHGRVKRDRWGKACLPLLLLDLHPLMRLSYNEAKLTLCLYNLLKPVCRLLYPAK